MFGFGKKTSKLFELYSSYGRMGFAILSKARMGDIQTASEYIGGLTYVLADVTAIIADKNREKLYDTITSNLFAAATDQRKLAIYSQVFGEIVDFFTPFVQGKIPKMVYWGGAKKPEMNPYFACIAAYLDLFVNPAIKTDGYDAAPLPKLNAMDLLPFTQETVIPFTKIMMHYITELTDVLE